MLRYFNGTVFNADAEVLVNTVNCDGFMGSGIALEFMLRFPKMFADYKKLCENGEIEVGRVSFYGDENCKVVNFPTKNHYRFPSKIEWIESGLKDFVRIHKLLGCKSIAFPKLGTSHGGLDWEDVKKLMEKYLSNLDIDVVICLDELKEAQGVEAKMVSFFNENYISIFGELSKLTKRQKEILQANVPIRRFWHLSKLEGIGDTTYSKIHKICLEHACDKRKSTVQPSFFD